MGKFTAMLFNPYTGEPRNPADIESDPMGRLIVPPAAPVVAAKVPSGREAAMAARLKVWRTYNDPQNILGELFPPGTALITEKQAMIVMENHGGYLGVRCVLCGASGWDQRFKHKPTCEFHND